MSATVEVEEADFGSPSTIAKQARATFLAYFAKGCNCPSLELRAEGAALECAHCARPLRLRRAA